jgi:hypothetical protein
MGWEALLRPVGPLPVLVYWWRRAVALSALILFIVLFAWACGGSSTKKPPARTTGGGPQATRSATPSHSASAAPTGSTPACAGADLAVSADMTASTYPGGAPPQVEVTVVDNGSAACTLDLGANAVVVTVTSGQVRNWSNADCGTKTPNLVVLSPGTSKKTTIAWDRHRSDPECKSTVTSLLASPGTYVAAVTVLGKTAAFPSGGNVFTLA